MHHASANEFNPEQAHIEQMISAANTDKSKNNLAVLHQPIWNGTVEDAVSTCLNGQRNTALFLNAHCANIMTHNLAYAQALARADYVFPDGIGIELAARMTGQRVISNLNGTDLVPILLEEAGRRSLSVFLLGARPGVAIAAAQKLVARCPGLTIAGVRDGYDQSSSDHQTVDHINRSGADIVLVAKGVPLQELWIDRCRDQLDAKLVMGVGALFDFVSGTVPRAPLWFRKYRLEWLYRLSVEPKRLARRYLIGNAQFMSRAAHHAVETFVAGTVKKRLLDISLACFAILFLSPILLLTALAIRLDSRGAAIFSQRRVGKTGVSFKFYKFRTMHLDAENRRAELLRNSDRTGHCFKSRRDPRVTRVGRILRTWSLDELPQIFNVLKGEMSFVGPRPALPSEVVSYPPHALERLMAKPGITGLWQVSGRADIGFDKMVELDIAYIKTRSLWLDLLLLAVTVRAVLLRQGAY